MKKIILFLTVLIFSVGNFVDTRDNTTYNTFIIGDKTWLKENLKFISKDTLISNSGSLNIKNYFEEYGAYYSYDSAMKVCPDGYHAMTLKEFKVLLKEMKGTANELGGKVVSKKELDTYGFKLGGFTSASRKVSWNTQIGFYWTSSDTLKTYHKKPEDGLQRHLIGIHIYNKKETDSFNIEPTYVNAQDNFSKLFLNCKCVSD